MLITRKSLKIKRIFDEFPWLANYTEQDLVMDAIISRFDSKIMDIFPKRAYPEDALLLLDDKGNKVAEVGIRRGRFASLFYYWMKKEENILDTLERIGTTESVKIAYALSLDYSNIQGDSYPHYEIVIYKMPKRFPKMVNWVSELRRRVDNAIRQQLIAIGAEVETSELN